jgi:WD40 repeat protein
MWLITCCLQVIGASIASPASYGDNGLLQVVQSSKSNHLLTYSENRVATVWEVGNPKPIAIYPVKGSADGIAFHPTKNTILISDGSGFLEWNWSKKNPEPQALFSRLANTKEAIQDSNNVQRLDISHDGKVLAFRDTLGNIKMQEIPNGKARNLATVQLSNHHNAWIRWVPKSGFLAFNDLGDVHVYDVAKMQEYCVMKGNNDEVSSLDASLDGKLIAVGYWKGSTQVWNVEKKEIAKTIETGKDVKAIEVRFSPDGTHFCCAGTKTISVYQTNEMKLLAQWKGPKGGASALVMTKDNATVITVGEDPHPRYWDAKTGKERLPET